MPEYQVTIARYGTRSALRSEVYLNHGLYGEADGPIEMDYFVWVIRDDDHTFIVDTGFSISGGEKRSRSMLIDPPELFASLGINPQNAPTVIVTHSHYDHIGNLSYFNRSPIVIAQAEIEFWESPHAQRRQFHHSVEDEELAALFAARDEGRVRTFDDTLNVAPGIDVMHVGGHTPGQSIVRVTTSIGTILLASDAVHYYEELERDMPFSSVAELIQMYSGFDRIRAMLDSGEIQHMIPGHDPSTMERLLPLGRAISENIITLGVLASEKQR